MHCIMTIQSFTNLLRKLKIEPVKDPQTLERMFAVTYGISRLAYGSTPEEAVANFQEIWTK